MKWQIFCFVQRETKIGQMKMLKCKSAVRQVGGQTLPTNMYGVLRYPKQGTLTSDATEASSLLCCCLSAALSLCQRSKEDFWSLNNESVERTTLKKLLKKEN